MAPKVTIPTKRSRGILACFNGRLLYSCVLIALSQVNFGSDQSAFGNTQAMPFFKRQFGTFNEATGTYDLDTVYLSLLNSINYVDFMFGLVTGNLLSRQFGRRIALFIMCLWALTSAVNLVTSKHGVQIIVGRTVAYIYIGMELALVPVLQSELAPAEVRGFVVGTYQQGMMSPRWLLLRNRPEEALTSLRLLREGRYTEQETTDEFNEIQSALNVTVESGSFGDLFEGTNRKRTFITVGTNVFLQLTGQNFSSVYGTIFIQSLGTVNPFAMSCVLTATGFFMVLVTQLISDKSGRVPLLVSGAVIQTGALLTMGGLGTIPDPSDSIKNGIVSVSILFGAGFCLGWAPLSHVVAAEIPTTALRDLTYAFGSVFNITIQFAVSFSIPYLLSPAYAGLGSKVGFIFGSTSFLAILFAWFCIPDCGGKTLEEIDGLFLRGVSVRKFRTTSTETLGADSEGHGDIEGAGKDQSMIKETSVQ
ncbi:hypothetical protein BN1723_006670 [Verticillium longisporum]|uniref:Major facilitator superfamily (MFS) profile domain-containing protein n=1 Tax=Verticillium longisporum TaxID=100787 RepID=A0A0G4NGM6_VERLO|nr:hypothetical protein BN1723_006670 [Verticillium longisporum]